MDNFFQKNIIAFFLIFVCGIFLGWFLFHSSTPVANPEVITAQEVTTWTCSSHPEILKTESGLCPICNLALIPLNKDEKATHSDEVRFANSSADLAKLSTTIVTKQSPMKEIFLYGKVQADELVVQKQVATISGRVDKMMINATGERVRKGQLLAMIYSPEYVSAQQDFFEAKMNKKSNPETFNQARNRLIKFGLNDAQIAAIEIKDRVEINTQIVASIPGVITARHTNDGEYIGKGTVIYEIADLSKVWIIFDVNESDLPFLNKGDLLSFTCKALPGTTFKGNIQFIYPDVDAKTRSSKVRVEFDNQSGVLKPDMYTTGTVQANLSKYSDELSVPQSSVLRSDSRSFVYVKETTGNETIFKARDVTLGPKIGDSYIIISGLSEGEEIILKGASDLRKS